MSENIENSYQRFTLDEIASSNADSFVDGPFGSSLKTHEYVSEGVRLIQLQNIGEGEWKDDNKKYITERKYKTLIRHGAVAGDIAIAKMADPVARACIVPNIEEQYIVVADCIKLSVNESKFDSSYIVRAINSHYTRSEAEKKSIGTTRIRINLGVLKTVGCLVPSLPEQQKISQILDTLDTTIRQTEAIIEKLKQIKQGLLHDLLTRGIDDNGELRPPPEVAPELYKESALGLIPKEWDIMRLEDISQNSTIGPFGSNLVASDYQTEGVPVVFVRDVRATGFEWNSSVYLKKTKAITLSAHDVEPGDVLATKMGLPPCISAVYPAWMPRGIITADIIRFRVNSDIFRPYWVSLCINSQSVIKQVEAITAGVTRPKVTLGDARGILIKIPKINEQDEIISSANAINDKLKYELLNLKKLKIKKSGLMDDLLTGRVRVTPLLAETSPISP